MLDDFKLTNVQILFNEINRLKKRFYGNISISFPVSTSWRVNFKKISDSV